MSLLRTYPPGSLLKPDREQRKSPKTPVQKRPGKDEGYLKLVRQLPCAICKKAPPSDVHHLKATKARGGAMRSPDKFSIPLCRECHNQVERWGTKNEIANFKRHGIDCLTLADALYANKELGLEAMRHVLQSHIGGR